ncbi:MAG: PIN domain-containing protein [Armatimonadota bacterium]
MRPHPSPSVLIDTDVLSFFFNQDPVRVPRYRPHLEDHSLYISFVTVAEMRYGARLRGRGPSRLSALDHFFERYTMVGSSPDLGSAWAEIRAHTRRAGRPIASQDSWIAAAAVILEMPLVTHNATHFQHVPLLRIITEPDG